jgi:hypothetical protein
MSAAELDDFFNELNMKVKIDNYLNHDIHPWAREKNSYRHLRESKQLYQKIDEVVTDDIDMHQTINVDTIRHNLQQSLDKCNDTIQCMSIIPIPEPETCPVCFVEFEESNYVIPKCKHKICAICFTNNIKYNKTTGDCCVICRERIC